MRCGGQPRHLKSSRRTCSPIWMRRRTFTVKWLRPCCTSRADAIMTEETFGLHVLNHHARGQTPFTSNSLWQAIESGLPDRHLAWLYLENFTQPLIKGARSTMPEAASLSEPSLLDLIAAQPSYQWVVVPADESPLGVSVNMLRLPCGERRESILLLEADGRSLHDETLLRDLQWCCLALGLACAQERLGTKLRNSQ